MGRVGRLTATFRACHMTQFRGCLILFHCWKTGIDISASAHMSSALQYLRNVESLPNELCSQYYTGIYFLTSGSLAVVLNNINYVFEIPKNIDSMTINKLYSENNS